MLGTRKNPPTSSRHAGRPSPTVLGAKLGTLFVLGTSHRRGICENTPVELVIVQKLKLEWPDVIAIVAVVFLFINAPFLTLLRSSIVRRK